MRQFDSSVIANEGVAESYHELVFSWPKEAQSPEPGQFLTIRSGLSASGRSTDPLLRRPFAVSAFSGLECRIVYQRRGKATQLLSALRSGDTIDVLGPLGNSFPFSRIGGTTSRSDRRPVIVAGGIGLGPMLFLDARLRAKSVVGLGISPRFVYGCRDAKGIPRGLLPKGADICTDDGSVGFKGFPVEFLANLDPSELLGSSLYACGPTPLLAALESLAASRGMDAFFAIEQVMACGVGACMGCVVRARDGSYRRVCTDGPVFPAGIVDWGRS